MAALVFIALVPVALSPGPAALQRLRRLTPAPAARLPPPDEALARYGLAANRFRGKLPREGLRRGPLDGILIDSTRTISPTTQVVADWAQGGLPLLGGCYFALEAASSRRSSSENCTECGRTCQSGDLDFT